MITKFKIFDAIEWYSDGKFTEEEGNDDVKADVIGNIYFTEFLLLNGAYDNYINEISKSKNLGTVQKINDYLKKQYYDLNAIINSTLTWDNTAQGFSYWEKLNDLWNDEVKADFKKRNCDF